MSFDILVVDDEPSIRKSLARLLRGSGYSVRLADCGEAALGEARRVDPDLVLLDVCLPDTNGLEVLTRLKQINDRTVVIAMTAHESTRDAVVAIKGGAYDYLSKPFNIEATQLLIKKALESGRESVRRERRARLAAPPWQGSACDRMIGGSPAMRRVLDVIHRLPPGSASNVLIEGETGTGKELLAHAVHEMSARAAEPFVAVCCGAIPRDLIESELFGYDKGAYTGARSEGKPGVFERAGNGTIFLDEIGELDLDLQVKFLRVLEAREFCRVGGVKRIPLHARLIAATNRTLKQDVDSGVFRADLYYRLNVLRIELPTLKERKEDIIPLVKFFLGEFNTLFGKSFDSITPPAAKLLEDYPWPGNIRELRNIIERIVLLETGDTVLPDHLPAELLRSQESAIKLTARNDLSGGMLPALERDCIVQALERTGGNVVNAARLLGLKRGALRYRMDKYNLTKEAFVPRTAPG